MTPSDRDAARAQQIADDFGIIGRNYASLYDAIQQALTEARDDAYTACSALGWKTPKDALAPEVEAIIKRVIDLPPFSEKPADIKIWAERLAADVGDLTD